MNNRVIWNDSLISKLKELVSKSISINEISEILNINKNSVASAITRYGIKSNYKNNICQNRCYHDYDFMYNLYITQGKSMKEISDELNISLRTVKKWCCEKFGFNSSMRSKIVRLNNIQKDLVMAGILGDGCVSENNGRYYYIESHCEQEKEYLYWKYSIMKNLCNFPPAHYNRSVGAINGVLCNIQDSYRFNTYNVLDLKLFHKIDKSIIISYLNEFMLSIYLLDDGNRTPSCWELCIANLSESEASKLIYILVEKFNFNAYLKKSDKRYLHFDANSSRILDKMILNNIPNNLDVIYKKILSKKIKSENNYLFIKFNENSIIGLSRYCKLNKINYEVAKSIFYNNQTKLLPEKLFLELYNSYEI